MAESPTVVWFRQDLRIEDNPALWEAVKRGGPVVPVYVWAPEEEGAWPPGAASRYWLHQSLQSLKKTLAHAGSRLIIRQGSSLDELDAVARSVEAGAVFWNRRYEPEAVKRDEAVARAFKERGVAVRAFNGSLLVEPWEVATKQGRPYKVFTPFWKTCLEQIDPPNILSSPQEIPAPNKWPRTLATDALKLEPKVDWAAGIREAWAFGEAAAHQRLDAFIDESLGAYLEARDQPGKADTSMLSPYLHYGEISPRQIWHAVQTAAAQQGSKAAERGAAKFLDELGWREFSHHLLHHFPQLPEAPMQDKFAAFPWEDDPQALKAWQRGETGYPIVDAGMRQLWETGWMHNRVRMITASLLTKDLLISWNRGAEWFWDTLVDADLANNTQGWQWTAGCGADAAPYFRIFNPVSQGERFDAKGDYVRRWVPELAALPDKWIHKPWEASKDVLDAAGVELNTTYPSPIIAHAEARERALTMYNLIK